MARRFVSSWSALPSARDVELLDPEIDAEDDHADVARLLDGLGSDGDAVALELDL